METKEQERATGPAEGEGFAPSPPPQRPSEGRRSGEDLVKAAAEDPSSLDEREVADATAWLLADDPSVAPIPQRTYEVNVGTDVEPHHVEWTLRAIDGDELRRIQRKAEQATPASQGGRGQTDEMAMHAQVVVEASLDPDLKATAKQAGATDAARFLRQRFFHKPGLIAQLSAMVMTLSGFDSADVEAAEVEAAKNS